jgi:hypothetical protein
MEAYHMDIGNDVIKTMVFLSETEEEADGVIEEFTPLRAYGEKLNFLLNEFPNVSILAGCNGENADIAQTDYQAVLSAVINLKWR